MPLLNRLLAVLLVMLSQLAVAIPLVLLLELASIGHPSSTRSSVELGPRGIVAAVTIALVLAGWPGMLIVRRVMRRAATLSWFTIAVAIMLGFGAGMTVVQHGRRISNGWIPVMGLDETAASWIFLGFLPYACGVGASYVVWRSIRTRFRRAGSTQIEEA